MAEATERHTEEQGSGRTHQPLTVQALGKRGGVAVVLSATVNAVLLALILAGDLVAEAEHLAVGPVVTLSVLGAVGATVVYGVLDRFSSGPDRLFTAVAAVVLVVSFVPNANMAMGDGGPPADAAVALAGLHVPVAVLCVLALTGTLFDR